MCQMQTALATVLPDYEESDLNKESDKVVESTQLVLAAYRRWHNQLQEELLESCAPKMH